MLKNFDYRSIGFVAIWKRCELVLPEIRPKTSPSTKLFKIRTLVPSTFAVRSIRVHSISLAYSKGSDLQVLQWWTEEFVRAITTSLSKMPYGMRYMAKETLRAVKASCTTLVL